MTLSALFNGDDVAFYGKSGDVKITGLTTDSRKVQKGYIFGALKGSAFDGQMFINNAIQAGASAILVEEKNDNFNFETREFPKNISVIVSKNIAESFANATANFYKPQPNYQVAVTGTNGKTSVVHFLRQIWEYSGFNSASIGTIGVSTNSITKNLGLTTPSPEVLHATLSDLKHQGIEYVAMEASSHGIVQHRLSGVKFCAAAFTNLTRDHLDYHGSFEAYREAKAELFSKLLPKNAPAIIDVDSIEGIKMAETAHKSGCEVRTVGKNGDFIKLLDLKTNGYTQNLSLEGNWGRAEVVFPLAGQFQVQNVLVAAGLALSTGVSAPHVFGAIQNIQGATGRLEPCGIWKQIGENNCAAFIDYAHTPDALKNAILALRPYVKGKLIIVFGCGGDRDPGKRVLMGEIAAEFADFVIITDDNPRSENPNIIRAAILIGAPHALEIADRAQAIETAVNMAQTGDIVLLAGKGHETGQNIAGIIHPFSDHEVLRMAIAKLGV